MTTCLLLAPLVFAVGFLAGWLIADHRYPQALPQVAGRRDEWGS